MDGYYFNFAFIKRKITTLTVHYTFIKLMQIFATIFKWRKLIRTKA